MELVCIAGYCLKFSFNMELYKNINIKQDIVDENIKARHRQTGVSLKLIPLLKLACYGLITLIWPDVITI